VFPTTDQSLLAAFLLCFMAAAIPLGFLIAAFFSRARQGWHFSPRYFSQP
jgi:hypothetical protein